MFVTIKECSSKGLSAFWRIFLIGNFQVAFLAVLRSLLLSDCQLLKEWLSFPDLWMCLIWVPAPISQLLLEGHFEVWSIFSASLVEPTEASKKTRRFAKAYRVRGSPQNCGHPCRNSKLGSCSPGSPGKQSCLFVRRIKSSTMNHFCVGRTCSSSHSCQWAPSLQCPNSSAWKIPGTALHSLSNPPLVSLRSCKCSCPCQKLECLLDQRKWRKTERRAQWCSAVGHPRR